LSSFYYIKTRYCLEHALMFNFLLVTWIYARNVPIEMVRYTMR
jgi:hypothetical protein